MKTITVELTRDEATVLSAAVQDWIVRSGKRRPFWKRLGWIDAMLYSRSIYTSARDKLDDALKAPAKVTK